MGYTLLRHAPSGPELYLSVLRAAGYQVSLSGLEEAQASAREFYFRATRTGRDFESSMAEAVRFWTEYIAIILDGVEIPLDRQQQLAERIYTKAWSPGAWQVYPDVLGTLARLRARDIRLAVVSNFVDTLHAVCDLHELTPFFDVIVASVQAGAMKPDPRIFAHAVRRLGVAPQDSWHVGDNYWTDVMGARAAGLVPVLLDRAGAVARADCLKVGALDELLGLLDDRAELRGTDNTSEAA
jgi:putative hydrolase of the HAD superfamily